MSLVREGAGQEQPGREQPGRDQAGREQAGRADRVGKRGSVGIDRTTWRALRTELIRGTAPMAALSIAVAGGAMLFNETERWAGRWNPLAEYISVILFALLPLAAAAGAWQAGRERRRRIGDLLDSTARPSGQPLVLAWAAVTLGAFAGLLLVWASGAVLVARVATYGGRGWWLTLAVAFAGLAAAAAIGVAAGRLIPSRVVAPVIGLVVFVSMGMGSGTNGSGYTWLTPSMDWTGYGVEHVSTDARLLQLLWLAGLTVTVLVLVSSRRRWLVVAPAAAAIVAAAWLVNDTRDVGWQRDPAAAELVCTDDGGPEVCMTRVNAFLLEDAKGPVREQLARWEGIDGGFVRAVDSTAHGHDPSSLPDGTAGLDLSWLVSWNGGLSEQNEYGETVQTSFASSAGGVVNRHCDLDGGEPSPEEQAVIWAGEIAYYWVLGDPDPVGMVLGEGENHEFQTLLAKPEVEQKDWLSRYMMAARSCDTDMFAALVRELQ
ncbi:hypothetical protein [Phytoactinopolyspora halotolerans]|uniref:Uncharacterized protein n=1 Tax=Phytoactinopolyspora halotolerans TaxID=1981512 RepID=A0A6L9SDJ1_9ACTN|nr:hypothetical protein [Phytoactinopolyspora halotolerans]NEE03435.1 hypothetical protein [Phytoactinopolyspora halotolerans]